MWLRCVAHCLMYVAAMILTPVSANRPNLALAAIHVGALLSLASFASFFNVALAASPLL